MVPHGINAIRRHVRPVTPEATRSLPLENIIAIASAVDQAPTQEAAILEPARWTSAAARALVDSLNGIGVEMSPEFSRRQKI